MRLGARLDSLWCMRMLAGFGELTMKVKVPTLNRTNRDLGWGTLKLVFD